MRPLAIDLYCGLGGWTEGLLAEGYYVVGFDIERHEYGVHRYPGQLVVQDVLTLDGSQFADATLIVASPPCQEYSYMAMPWSRAKQIAAALRNEGNFPVGYKGSRTVTELNALFDGCFRIQREACAAAKRHIPLIVENVKGAQPWIGRARWNFGSYYLWGDVPALMPPTFKAQSVERHTDASAYKSQGMNWSDRSKHGQDFTRLAGDRAIKNTGGSWFNVAHNTASGCGQNPDGRKTNKGDCEGYGGSFGWDETPLRQNSSSSPRRKFASAMIAKIPLPLSRHIAAVYRP